MLLEILGIVDVEVFLLVNFKKNDIKKEFLGLLYKVVEFRQEVVDFRQCRFSPTGIFSIQLLRVELLLYLYLLIYFFIIQLSVTVISI